MALETDKVGSISTWAAESTPALHATEHNALHVAYNAPIGGVDFVIGSEAADNINVGLQLNDLAGDALAVIGLVYAFFSDAVTGIGITSTVPDADVVIGTDGAIIGEIVTDGLFLLQSEADGDIDLDVGDTGTPTFYLVVVLPSGLQVVSAAITFA